MGSIKGELYRLIDHENKWGEIPTDLMVVKRTATLSGSEASIDLTGVVRKGAPVKYHLCKRTSTDSSAGTITASAAAIGATDEVDVFIFFRASDRAMAGE